MYTKKHKSLFLTFLIVFLIGIWLWRSGLVLSDFFGDGPENFAPVLVFIFLFTIFGAVAGIAGVIGLIIARRQNKSTTWKNVSKYLLIFGIIYYIGLLIWGVFLATSDKQSRKREFASLNIRYYGPSEYELVSALFTKEQKPHANLDFYNDKVSPTNSHTWLEGPVVKFTPPEVCGVDFRFNSNLENCEIVGETRRGDKIYSASNTDTYGQSKYFVVAAGETLIVVHHSGTEPEGKAIISALVSITEIDIDTLASTP